jgi:hypothetical protein
MLADSTVCVFKESPLDILYDIELVGHYRPFSPQRFYII